MGIIRWLRRALLALTMLLALLIAALVVCAALEVSINLAPLRAVIERSAAAALGRPVTIAGLELTPALQPTLALTGVRIGNPTGWQTADFVRIERARAQFRVPPLLNGRLELQQVTGEDLQLALVHGPDGAANWRVPAKASATDQAAPLQLSELGELMLRRVAISYREAETEPPVWSAQLDQIGASAATGAPGKLAFSGRCQQQPCKLTAQLHRSGARFRLSELRGGFGETSVSGQAEFDLTEGQLRLKGQLDTRAVDVALLRPWLRGADLSGRIERVTLKTTGQGTDLKTLVADLALELQIDDARLRLGQVEPTALAVNLSRAELTLAQGQPLRATVTGTLRDIPIALSAVSDIATLAEPIDSIPLQASGKIGDASIRLDGRVGRRTGRLALDLQLDVSGEHFSQPAALLGISGAPALPYRVRAQLTHSDNQTQLSKLEAKIGTTTVQGALTVHDPGGAQPLLKVKLHAPVLNLAEPTTTATRDQSAPLAQKLAPAKARQDEAALKLGRAKRRQMQTALTQLGFDTRGADGLFGRHTRSAIRAFQRSRNEPPSGFLTASQLAVLRDHLHPATKPTPATAKPWFDQPLLPTGVQLIDADLDLALDRLVLSARADLSKLTLKGRLRNGQMEQSSFQATLGRDRFNGGLALDLRHAAPRVRLELASQRLDIGALLRRFRIADDLELSAGKLSAQIATHGSTPRELLARATLKATLADGRWVLDDPQLAGKTSFTLARSTLQAKPGQPVRLAADARFRDTPFRLTLRGEPLTKLAKLAKLASGGKGWPLELSAESADARLELSQTVRLPLAHTRLAARLKLSGERLDHLGPLLKLALPPWGPYRLGGMLQAEETGYRLQALDLRIGASDLRGRIDLVTAGEKPRLDLQLQADTLQLDDFGVGARHLAGAAEQTPASSVARIPTESYAEVRQALERLLKLQFIQGVDVDARLALETRQVLLGKETLVGGSFAARLENGRFTVERARLQFAGGAVDAQLALQPSAGDVAAELKLDIDRFDYGMLARHLQPQTTLRGHFSLDAALSSRSLNLGAPLANASGPIRFVLWPDELDAGPLTWWELNLLTLLLPKLDSTDSKLNCVVGRYTLEDGLVKITPGALIIDTTKVRATAHGEVNFKTQHLDLMLIPKVKAIRIFDLATPVHVRGPFPDVDAGIKLSGLMQTAVRGPLGLTHLWLQFFNWDKLPPADGGDVCGDSQRPTAKQVPR